MYSHKMTALLMTSTQQKWKYTNNTYPCSSMHQLKLSNKTQAETTDLCRGKGSLAQCPYHSSFCRVAHSSECTLQTVLCLLLLQHTAAKSSRWVWTSCHSLENKQRTHYADKISFTDYLTGKPPSRADFRFHFQTRWLALFNAMPKESFHVSL